MILNNVQNLALTKFPLRVHVVVLRAVSGVEGTTRGDAKDPPMKKKKLIASQGQIISRAF